ncbi:hypothetical protein DPMN_194303 [Dreissena polymorpha]|uniref:Uncharacterized protein n=1 Tax=Dreissena polymorpha TaxID=45954 RepID=A0A9D4B7U3_DREPO|nr:hypothetical protein DPMN_194303 [Dreissena polymorpha]
MYGPGTTCTGYSHSSCGWENAVPPRYRVQGHAESRETATLASCLPSAEHCTTDHTGDKPKSPQQQADGYPVCCREPVFWSPCNPPPGADTGHALDPRSSIQRSDCADPVIRLAASTGSAYPVITAGFTTASTPWRFAVFTAICTS